MKLNDNKLNLIFAIIGVVLTTIAQLAPSTAVVLLGIITSLGTINGLIQKYMTAPGDIPGPEKAAAKAAASPKAGNEL